MTGTLKVTRMTDTHGMVGLVPTAAHQRGRVVEQVKLAKDTYRLRIECPQIAQQIVPGQFFMIRDPRVADPMLGRPFALFDTYCDVSGKPAGFDFGYLVVGKMTQLMTSWAPGDEVELWGPLGNGFPVPDGRRLFLIAGGIGQTPFRAVAREALGFQKYGTGERSISTPPKSLTMCYGVRSKEYLAALDWFTHLNGLAVRVATDDGSYGHHGYVTDLLRQSYDSAEPPEAIYCCGPEPMMAAVAKIAEEKGTPCWLSLESPMACGFGICFSCVTRVRQDDGSWDYRRTCVEGPVFPADKLCL